VLHAYLDRSVIVAQRNARAEQEVIIDVARLEPTDSMINLDGTNASCCDLRTPVTDLYSDGRIFNRLIADWRLAASRYEHWKNLLRDSAASGTRLASIGIA
jgi:hypothetical protein